MSMCNVLAILGDDEAQISDTLAAAVELADAEHARLTLAKTCVSCQRYLWASPFLCGNVYLPPEDKQAEASRALARAIEQVPSTIPVTTFVLGPETGRELRRLVHNGNYNALVAPRRLLSHRPRLCQELQQLGILTLPVPAPSSGRLDRGLDPLRKGGRVLVGGARRKADEQLAEPVPLEAVVNRHPRLVLAHGLQVVAAIRHRHRVL